MKKIFSVLLVALIFLSFSASIAFAGSIPEDLLYDDCSQVFFAKVVDYDLVEEHSEIKVIPVKSIKGDVTLESETVYYRINPTGIFALKKGYTYLFAYLDEHNPTYIFRVSDYDTKILKLIDVNDDNNMWKRFENYLNEGKYEKAEKKRKKASKSTEADLQSSAELPALHTKKQTYISISAFGIAIVCITLGVIIYKGKKRKK